MNKTSFTLIELIIVVVVLAILVGLAMPWFFTAQERAIDREAQTNLRLIRTAQLHLELETGAFAGCNSNQACNNLLDIDLPPNTASGGNWNYRVTLTGGGSGFTARAQGTRGSQGTWQVTHANDEPS